MIWAGCFNPCLECLHRCSLVRGQLAGGPNFFSLNTQAHKQACLSDINVMGKRRVFCLILGDLFPLSSIRSSFHSRKSSSCMHRFVNMQGVQLPLSCFPHRKLHQ